jgi:hypothetical protein
LDDKIKLDFYTSDSNNLLEIGLNTMANISAGYLAPPQGRWGGLLICLLAALAGVLAETSDFRGVNWAVLGDNFKKVPLVLHGLDGSDSYTTIRAKAQAVYAGFEDNLGTNTVRLPINTHTVSSPSWDTYSAVIDTATERGLKVILAYWEDGVASGGRVNSNGMPAWNSMWDTVTNKYGNNSLVHFEIMNEPHGYNARQWTDMAAAWIAARPAVPRKRILVGGTGFSQDLKPVCADSRLDGTLLSYHVYTFFYGEKDYNGWVRAFRDGLGGDKCASRAITTEFGGPMDTGLDYGDAGSRDNFVRYLRAVTDAMRELRMGSTYWPALGGKIKAGQADDWYAMQKLHGSGVRLTLSTPSESGAKRLRHGWGL